MFLKNSIFLAKKQATPKLSLEGSYCYFGWITRNENQRLG